MIDVKELVGAVFSGLSVLVIEGVADGGDVIVVRARTRNLPVACPGCGTGVGPVAAGARHLMFLAYDAARSAADPAAFPGGAAGAGIDDVALRRSRRYATVLIDAETGRRVDVLPGRTADAAEKCLRDHPGIEIVCRDGSGAYGNSRELHLTGDVCPVSRLCRQS